MTSIEKASHEDVATQEEQLFKWLTDCTQNATTEIRTGPMTGLPGKTYKDEPMKFAEGYFYHAYKLDRVAIGLYYEEGKLVGDVAYDEAASVAGWSPARLGGRRVVGFQTIAQIVEPLVIGVPAVNEKIAVAVGPVGVTGGVGGVFLFRAEVVGSFACHCPGS